MNRKSVLEEKVKRLESLFDMSKLINSEANSIKKIKRYYRMNDFAYRMFHSDRGFMHFRVTKGAELKDDDILYQPDVISKYINKESKILELGPGQGANLLYLAKKHPDAAFLGIDLCPKKIKNSDKQNIKIYKHDYSDLSFIESNSIDIVYGIETIVHCTDKLKVFKEVYRVLKEGGIFIIYDYALVKEIEKYIPYEQTAIKIISKGGASALIEPSDSWNTYLSQAGFTKVSIIDLHKELLPDLKRLEHKADHFFKTDKRAKILMRLMPKTFSNNIIVGWLGFDTYNEDVGYYNEWIFSKASDYRNC